MNQVVAIALGGALGSVLRYWMSTSVHAVAGRAFPYGTLAVNALGSLLMGLLFVLFLDRLGNDTVLRAGILIGLLGGFTTFSAFSIETVNLIEQGVYFRAAVNGVASVLLCVGAAWIGVVLGRQL